MEVIIKPRAAQSLRKVVDFVESKNTEGSGLRWYDRVMDEVQSLAASKAKLTVCKHPTLAKFNYRCFVHGTLVVACRITAKRFEVCRFIWGGRLT